MADTKTRILDAALSLFNEQGTANVTTNYIAEELGMSPGNLYYHYRNKAEIVRALFARIAAEWADNFAMPSGTIPGIETIEAMVAGNFDIQVRYLFFFRDLALLLNSDPLLAAAYRENRAAGLANTRAIIELFIQAGVAKPLAREELDDLAHMLWFVGDFWLAFMDAGGADCGPQDRAQGVRLFRRILTPYLTGLQK